MKIRSVTASLKYRRRGRHCLRDESSFEWISFDSIRVKRFNLDYIRTRPSRISYANIKRDDRKEEIETIVLTRLSFFSFSSSSGARPWLELKARNPRCRPLLNHPFHLWKSFLSLFFSPWFFILDFSAEEGGSWNATFFFKFHRSPWGEARWKKEDVRIRKGSGEADRDWLGTSSRKRVCLVSQFSGGGACVPFICIIQLVS